MGLHLGTKIKSNGCLDIGTEGVIYDAKYEVTTLYKEFPTINVTILILLSMFSPIIYDAKYEVTILYFIVADKRWITRVRILSIYKNK